MIYLLTDGTNLKIGFTNNIAKRLKQYQTHSSTISLISHKEGNKYDEYLLHDKFKMYRIKNEWFKYSDELINYFKEYRSLNITHKDNSESININITDTTWSNLIGSGKELQVLCTFWRNCQEISNVSPGNMITINKKLMCEIEKQTNLNTQSVRNIIVGLKKKELIISDKDCRGVYYLNPKYFFKGNSNERLKCYTRTIEYQITD